MSSVMAIHGFKFLQIEQFVFEMTKEMIHYSIIIAGRNLSYRSPA